MLAWLGSLKGVKTRQTVSDGEIRGLRRRKGRERKNEAAQNLRAVRGSGKISVKGQRKNKFGGIIVDLQLSVYQKVINKLGKQ